MDELKKNELSEEKLKNISGGNVSPEDHNIFLTIPKPSDFDTDIQTGDMEKMRP